MPYFITLPRPRLVARGTALALGLGTLLAFGGAARAAELDVTVDVNGLTDGNVMIALYDSADNFRSKPLLSQSRAAAAAPVSFKFADLPAGEYAVAIYQDVNSNGKLDSNLMGIPNEPFGFSREPKGLMGPPKWDQVKFTLPDGQTALAIGLGK